MSIKIIYCSQASRCLVRKKNDNVSSISGIFMTTSSLQTIHFKVNWWHVALTWGNGRKFRPTQEKDDIYWIELENFVLQRDINNHS